MICYCKASKYFGSNCFVIINGKGENKCKNTKHLRAWNDTMNA